MSRVISFISRKGGTGKTTAAINLATAAHKLKYKVCIVETDTNYTLSTLRNIELQELGNKKSPFEIFGSDDESVVDDIQNIRSSEKYDLIIVDSAGKTTNEHIKMLALESDLIIVPTSLTKNDYVVTYQTVEDLKPALNYKNQMNILLLPNRIHTLTKSETITKALEGIDAEVLNFKIPQRNDFANFSTITPESDFLKPAKEIINHLNN
jgi:chromosome partitioning protein